MSHALGGGHNALLRVLRGLTSGGLEGKSSFAGLLDPDDRKTPTLVIEALDSVSWASATFLGQRHRLELRLDGGDGGVAESMAERLARRLLDIELGTVGHVLVDISHVGTELVDREGIVSARLTFEALTLED